MQYFIRIFVHLKITQPFLCFWVSQVYVFLIKRNIGSPRWIFISCPVGFVVFPVESLLTPENFWKFDGSLMIRGVPTRALRQGVCLICSFEISNVFIPAEGTTLGCFWAVFGCNPLKCGEICLKFWPVMQCNIMHHSCDGFNFFLKRHLKLSQKNNFLAHFERFLVYAFLRPLSYTPIFCQI